MIQSLKGAERLLNANQQYRRCYLLATLWCQLKCSLDVVWQQAVHILWFYETWEMQSCWDLKHTDTVTLFS